jgi:hypothetical protein
MRTRYHDGSGAARCVRRRKEGRDGKKIRYCLFRVATWHCKAGWFVPNYAIYAYLRAGRGRVVAWELEDLMHVEVGFVCWRWKVTFGAWIRIRNLHSI